MILLSEALLNPAIVPITSTLLLAVIGFFLIRYFKSVDKKLEMLSGDINAINISNSVIKQEQQNYIQIVAETKTKLDDFIDEIRNILERIKNQFDEKIEKVNEKIDDNHDAIIRLQVKEEEMIRKIERLELGRDTCNLRNNG